MDWDKLLCEKRTRELVGGPSSTKGSTDERTQFERDYDRAVFSAPVRRLQDKTQVFPLDPSDAVRTRLTHSLEVSTLARDMANSITCRLLEKRKINKQQALDISSIAATCGLVHDLGNPPFGHSGEEAVRTWFKNHSDLLKSLTSRQQQQDFLKFEGNAQTLRLLSKLQVLSDLYGLNLTSATLSASCKYVAASDKIQKSLHEFSKPGHFYSENDLIEKVREITGTGKARHPITYIVEASDDIVYSVVDLEDGVKKEVIDWGTVKHVMRDTGKHGKRCIKEAEKYIDRGGIYDPGKAPDNVYIQAFRTSVIYVLSAGALTAFMKIYDQILDGEYHGEIVDDCSVTPLIRACKKLGKDYVYCSPETLRLELMGRNVLHDLMDLFWEGCSVGHKDSKSDSDVQKIFLLTSDNYRKVFLNSAKNNNSNQQYHRLQLLTDYVSGMTDTFACSLHKKLFNG